MYIILVLGLIYWSSKLALVEIAKNERKFHIPWIGIIILVLGIAFVQYYEYNKRYDMKPYTRKQVAEKNAVERGGVWLVVNNDVYDVTPFIKKHPPGSALIMQRAGTDATRHYNYHLEATKHFWRQSKIGWIVDDESEKA